MTKLLKASLEFSHRKILQIALGDARWPEDADLNARRGINRDGLDLLADRDELDIDFTRLRFSHATSLALEQVVC